MNYHDIQHANMANGEGLRTVIWVSGCCHNCPGCFNPETHEANSGILFDENAKIELFNDLKYDWCAGLTFSGGDPLFGPNVETVLSLCKEAKEKFPDKTIWLWTGYTVDFIFYNDQRKDILKYVDVICDGKFIKSLKSPNLKWVGSSNQNIINVQNFLKFK